MCLSWRMEEREGKDERSGNRGEGTETYQKRIGIEAARSFLKASTALEVGVSPIWRVPLRSISSAETFCLVVIVWVVSSPGRLIFPPFLIPKIFRDQH